MYDTDIEIAWEDPTRRCVLAPVEHADIPVNDTADPVIQIDIEDMAVAAQVYGVGLYRHALEDHGLAKQIDHVVKTCEQAFLADPGTAMAVVDKVVADLGGRTTWICPSSTVPSFYLAFSTPRVWAERGLGGIFDHDHDTMIVTQANIDEIQAWVDEDTYEVLLQEKIEIRRSELIVYLDRDGTSILDESTDHRWQTINHLGMVYGHERALDIAEQAH